MYTNEGSIKEIIGKQYLDVTASEQVCHAKLEMISGSIDTQDGAGRRRAT